MVRRDPRTWSHPILPPAAPGAHHRAILQKGDAPRKRLGRITTLALQWKDGAVYLRAICTGSLVAREAGAHARGKFARVFLPGRCEVWGGQQERPQAGWGREPDRSWGAGARDRDPPVCSAGPGPGFSSHRRNQLQGTVAPAQRWRGPRGDTHSLHTHSLHTHICLHSLQVSIPRWSQ